MKTLIITGTLALTAAFGAALPDPAAAQGLFGGFGGNVFQFRGGNCIGTCGVHRATPLAGGAAVRQAPAPVRMAPVAAPRPVHVAPPPGQSAAPMRTFTPPPPPGAGRR